MQVKGPSTDAPALTTCQCCPILNATLGMVGLVERRNRQVTEKSISLHWSRWPIQSIETSLLKNGVEQELLDIGRRDMVPLEQFGLIRDH